MDQFQILLSASLLPTDTPFLVVRSTPLSLRTICPPAGFYVPVVRGRLEKQG